MAAQLVVALLALLSLGAASEPDCAELVKPLVLDSHSPIYGKWVLHIGMWDEPDLKTDLSTVKSSWLELYPSSHAEVINVYWADRLFTNQTFSHVWTNAIPGLNPSQSLSIMNTMSECKGVIYACGNMDVQDRRNKDKCLQGLATATVSGITTHATFVINGHTSYHDGKYYETCEDCLLSEDTTLLPDGKSKGRYLFLYTRNGTLESSELEKFKKQAACLQFSPEYHFMSTDLCPDDRENITSAAAARTENDQGEA